MGKHLPKDLKALARSHTESALRVLAGIMTNSQCSDAARVAAANSILDRGWGKALQAVEVSGEVATKVIRAPAISADISDWADKHIPEQYKTEH
jgi:hypothetical protein